MKTTAIFFLLAISAFQLIQAQTAVTDIYTDYKGWWVGSRVLSQIHHIIF